MVCPAKNRVPLMGVMIFGTGGLSSNTVSVAGLLVAEPKLFEIWSRQARRLHDLLQPGKYFLSMDEIRAGGSDLACRQREMSMGQILGDCFTRQVALIRAANPDAEVFTWSDMIKKRTLLFELATS